MCFQPFCISVLNLLTSRESVCLSFLIPMSVSAYGFMPFSPSCRSFHYLFMILSGIIIWHILVGFTGHCQRIYTVLEGNFLKVKEICRETTTRGGGKMGFAYLVLLVICCSWAYEAYRFKATGVFSPVGLGMNLLWLGLWIWKVFYRYELILRHNELEIITIGLWKQAHYIVDLTRTESFAQHYRRNFFRRTRIKHYIHRYNMADANPTRILAFKEGKGLAAVIFCCSDEFLRELIRLMPDKYLEF